MKKPDFIGIGAQKAGTSWLHACLYEHPQIYMPASKELHFFSKYYARGLPWYDSLFRGAPSNQITGEFSPTYLYHLDAPKRIYDHNPQTKLLICLRDPIARTVSAYRYAVQTGAILATKSLEELIRERPAYVEHSLYTPQLERYLHFFSPDQILIMIYEDIATSPYAFMERVYQFLGVDTQFCPTMATRKVNPSRGVPRLYTLDRMLKYLAATCRQIGLGHLAWTLGRSRPIDMLQRLNRHTVPPSALSAAQIETLRQLFAPDIQALANTIGMDLSAYWPGYTQANDIQPSHTS